MMSAELWVRKPILRWGILVLLAAVVVGLVVVHYRIFTSPARYAVRDFMSLWTGGRALLKGADPYDPEVWLSMRAQYGSDWMPDDRVPFPVWTLVFMFPFAALPLDWAAAAWLVFSELLVGVSIFLLLSRPGQKPLPPHVLALTLGAFLLRGTLTSLNNGQITLVMLCSLALFLFCMRHDRPFWAGLFLTGIAFKPNPFIVLAPCLGLWLLWKRRWRVIGGGVTGAALCFVTSWLFLPPSWLLDWLNVRGKTEVTIITPTIWGLSHSLFADWWPVIGLALAIGLTAFLGWLVFARNETNPYRVVALGLITSLMVTPYAWAYDHALLLVLMVMPFAAGQPRKKVWWVWGALLLLPWACYAAADWINQDVVSVLVPLATASMLWTGLLQDHRDGGGLGDGK